MIYDPYSRPFQEDPYPLYKHFRDEEPCAYNPQMDFYALFRFEDVYRYFPAKEDVLQQRIDRRTEALRIALSARPADEPPLHSLRLALEEVMSAEGTALLKCWITVIRDTPTVLKGVVGGIQLKRQRMIAEFFASRLGSPSHALVPTMLAAAAEGVMQAAQTQWFVQGGDTDLATAMSEGLAVLERAMGHSDPRTWP